jgi:hypothetical protein
MLLTVGAIVINDKSFTTPIGTHFAAGEEFEVTIVGRSTMCHHVRTRSTVWLQGNTTGAKFLCM